jgi:hypothetical protein
MNGEGEFLNLQIDKLTTKKILLSQLFIWLFNCFPDHSFGCQFIIYT